MNAYLASVIETVKEKYASEPEFVQTVEEVFLSLEPVCQRPHMSPDNIPFSLCQLIFSGRIPQCHPRMIKTMQFMGIHFVRNMPVIKKIIVQQRAPDQFSSTAGNMQTLT